MINDKFTKAIVVPVYKQRPDKYEEISFDRCLKVFVDYPVYLACPVGLDTSYYRIAASDNGVSLHIEEFEKQFFEGVEGYNRLMLDKIFYERFSDYDRILIHQTDCFIFENNLDYWCKYDYAGAPWIHRDDVGNLFFKRLVLDFKRKVKVILGKKNDVEAVLFKSGNGGLSIRNPGLFIKMIDKFEKNGILEKYKSPKDYFYWEDIFWSIEVNKYLKYLKIPGFKEAVKFSFELRPSICYELNNRSLPFGCHAWAKYEIDFWKPFIEKYGYRL